MSKKWIQFDCGRIRGLLDMKMFTNDTQLHPFFVQYYESRLACIGFLYFPLYCRTLLNRPIRSAVAATDGCNFYAVFRCGLDFRRWWNRYLSCSSCRRDLVICIAAACIEISLLNATAEKSFVPCLDERCKHETTREQLYLEAQAEKVVALHRSIAKAENGVCSLERGYHDAARSDRNAHILAAKARIAIKRILMFLKALHLYCRMHDIIWSKANKNFHKQNIGGFIC